MAEYPREEERDRIRAPAQLAALANPSTHERRGRARQRPDEAERALI
jgi:hypothetical protein